MGVGSSPGGRPDTVSTGRCGDHEPPGDAWTLANTSPIMRATYQFGFHSREVRNQASPRLTEMWGIKPDGPRV